MSTTIKRSENKIMGVYHKLRRSFKDIAISDEIMYSNLGSSHWRKSAGKLRYLKTMLAVTRDRMTDVVTPFAQEMYGNVGKIVDVLEDIFVDAYVNEGQKVKQSLMKKLYEPKSIYKKNLHVASLAGYYSYRQERKLDLVIPDRVIKLYSDHRQGIVASGMLCLKWTQMNCLVTSSPT